VTGYRLAVVVRFSGGGGRLDLTLEHLGRGVLGGKSGRNVALACHFLLDTTFEMRIPLRVKSVPNVCLILF
jgi:hypothetical protein